VPLPSTRPLPCAVRAHGVAILVLTLLFALSCGVTGLVPASAQPAGDAGTAAAAGGSGTLSLGVSPAAVSPTGTVTLRISGATRAPIADLEVRFRIRRPSGKLVFQRTVSKSEIPAGPVSITVDKSFRDIDLNEGRYLVDARIVVDAQPPLMVAGRMFVVKPGRAPVPVVIVARFQSTPSTDPEGRFLVDPGVATASRDDVMALTGILSRQPALRVSIGMPPVLLDDWRRIMSGYTVIEQGGEGVRRVDKKAPVVNTYSVALQALRKTVGGKHAELLDIPFADPDLSGLAQMGALPDLSDHFARSASTYQASLGATPAAGTAVLGDAVSSTAAGMLARNHINWTLLAPSAVQGKTATSATGVYAMPNMRMRAIVLDEAAGRMLENRDTPIEDVLDHVFERLTSPVSGQPLVIPVRLGTGAPTDTGHMESVLAELGRTGWVRFETAGSTARRKPIATVTLKRAPSSGPAAPVGYWDDVQQARTAAHAFVEAVSQRDGDADAALYQALVAESRAWAGADGSWSLADRGRAFAAASQRRSDAVLGKVSASSSNITLSGTTGNMPLVVKNESAKTLSVFVMPSSGGGATFPYARVKATLRPGDNFITVPVDLGRGGVFSDVKVRVVSGERTLATTSLQVSASYLDRIAMVGSVAVVLAGLLFYIRRKVRSSTADTT
jgi:hypothetical protein